MSTSRNDRFILTASTAAIAVSGVLIFSYLQRKKKNEEKLIPMAPVGFFEVVKKLGGYDAPLFVWEMSKKMGDVNFRLPLPLGPGGLYIIGDSQLTRKIFMDTKTEKPRRLYAYMQGAGEKSLFTSGTDSYAKAIRKYVAHAFSKSELERMNKIAVKYVEEWMNGRLKKFAETGEPFDPGHEVIRLTFFIILDAAFEYEATEEEFETFQYNIETFAREFSMKQLSNPLRKVFGRFIPEVQKAIECGADSHRFSRKVIATYRNNPNKSPQKTLIKVLTEATCFESEAQLESEALTWIFAGQDTTGYTISNTLLLLAKHPEEQKKVREALLKNPEADAREVPEFHCILQESKRVLPVAAMGSIRETGKDILLEDGKVLPAGSVCFLNQFLCFRDPKLFEDPEKFRPQRWENATKEMEDAIMYFAIGNRNCPGQYLATAELNSLLPRILTRYSLELVNEGNLDFFITLKYNGTKFRATKL